MKNIFKILFKLGFYFFGFILLILTLKLLIPKERVELEYPNKGRWKEHNREDFISAEECGICHQEIFNQWKTSGMANATLSSLLEFDLHKIALSMRDIQKRILNGVINAMHHWHWLNQSIYHLKIPLQNRALLVWFATQQLMQSRIQMQVIFL